MLRLLTLRARMTRTAFLLLGLAANLAFAAIEVRLAPRLGWASHVAPHEIAAAPPAQAAWVIATALFYPMLFWARLHDIGRSGWWTLPLPAAVIGAKLLPGVLGAACLALGAGAWLVLLLWPGTLGANDYGADPRGWESPGHFAAQQAALAVDAAISRRGGSRW